MSSSSRIICKDIQIYLQYADVTLDCFHFALARSCFGLALDVHSPGFVHRGHVCVQIQSNTVMFTVLGSHSGDASSNTARYFISLQYRKHNLESDRPTITAHNLTYKATRVRITGRASHDENSRDFGITRHQFRYQPNHHYIRTSPPRR